MPAPRSRLVAPAASPAQREQIRASVRPAGTLRTERARMLEWKNARRRHAAAIGAAPEHCGPTRARRSTSGLSSAMLRTASRYPLVCSNWLHYARTHRPSARHHQSHAHRAHTMHALGRARCSIQQGCRWRRQASTGARAGDGSAWTDIEGGLRYRLSEDPVSRTETIEVEHANGGCCPSAVVILTHGLGDSARGWAQAALQLCSELPWTRWVLPSAPNMPVTLNGGMSMPAWYDIVGLSDRSAEHCDGIKQSHETLLRVADEELERLGGADAGLDRGARLVLAGFSQGGAMSLYSALRWPDAQPLPAGVLCMSGYLPLPDTQKAQLSAIGRVAQTPMLLCHGDSDPVVRPEWSTATVDRLTELGCEKVDHQWFPGLEHSVNEDELRTVANWLRAVLPPP